MTDPDGPDHSGRPAACATILAPAFPTRRTVRRRSSRSCKPDGRRSYAGIGKAVGLSEAAVRQRVQRMVDAGRHADRRRDRSVAARVRPAGDDRHPLHRGHPQAGRETSAIEAVDYVGADRRARSTPSARSSARDDDSLLELLNTQIRCTAGVITTETLVYLKLVKQQYNWGELDEHHRKRIRPTWEQKPTATCGATSPATEKASRRRSSPAARASDICDDKGKSYIDGLSGLLRRPGRPRPQGTRRGGGASRPRSCPSSRCGPTPHRPPSSWPSASPTTHRAI